MAQAANHFSERTKPPVRVMMFLEPVIFRNDPLLLSHHFLWADVISAAVHLTHGTFALTANDEVCSKWKERFPGDRRPCYPVDSFEVLAQFGYRRSVYAKAAYGGDIPFNRLTEALKKIRADFVPDLVVMTSQNAMAKAAFEGIPVLFVEQAPLPRLGRPLRTFCDPCGHQTGSILEVRTEDIKSIVISEQDANAIKGIVASLQEDLPKSHPDAHNAIAEVKKEGTSVALFATQPTDWLTYEGGYDVIEFENLLYSWAQRLPDGWIGVPTYHPGYRLSEAMEKALARATSKLAFLPASVSQGFTEALLPACDGLVTLSSTSAITALILGKRTIVCGRSPFNAWCSQHVEEIASKPILPIHDVIALLAFLSNRCCYLHDDLRNDSAILAEMINVLTSTESPADWFLDMSSWTSSRTQSLLRSVGRHEPH